MSEDWESIAATYKRANEANAQGRADAEAERDRLREDYAEAQAGWDKVSDENDRLREALERLNVRWFVSNQMRRRIASEALEDR